MKYNEETFKREVELKYNGEFEVIGHFKGISKPILVKNKYGVINLKLARLILNNTPTILNALNKTEYFMNVLKEKLPKIYEKIKPASEYKTAKEKMLFNTKYGLVSISPDALLAGHCPNVRSAVDRKEYMKNLLSFIYDNKYNFIINSTDRHSGRITLICSIHGPQSIDSDTVFTGCGCPQCNHGWEKSNLFYLVRLYDDNESFYKLGISHYIKDTKEIRRFKEYKRLNYNIEVIKLIQFNDFIDCRELETKLKRLIKNCLYTPKRWDFETSTECFNNDLLPLILSNLNDDIVSTSSESLSCQEIDEEKLTTSPEDNEV